MKILVLGGTGAMGVPIVQILSERGNHVYVTSRKKRFDSENIKYLLGDAHDLQFIEKILHEHYDAIIDFMVYTPQELEQRSSLFLNATNQYVFISSARVYADSKSKLITEESPRLLEVIDDKDYLETNEYALAKAREEDIFFKGAKNNYTIIRPYITYYDERFQLGVYEKEKWLQRVLEGKKIVLSKDIGECYTTLTYGYDVSLRIADLIGCHDALGEVYHITTEQSIKWKDVLDIYLDVLEKYLGKRPEIVWTQTINRLMEKYVPYQIHYDRMYDRCFDNTKIQQTTNENKPFCEVEVGLKKCLENFLSGKKIFSYRDWKLEAVLDRISGDVSNIFSINGLKNKSIYILYRFFIKVK